MAWKRNDQRMFSLSNLTQGLAMKWYARGQAAGIVPGITQGRAMVRLSSVQNLMETLGLTAEQAMDGLKIPESERQWILETLDKPEKSKAGDPDSFPRN